MDDQSEFEVTVRMPPGSSLEGTDGGDAAAGRRSAALPGIENLLTTVGRRHPQRQVDRGSILVELMPMDRAQRDPACRSC